MTDLNKVSPQQYEKYCANFHLLLNATPIDIIKSYRSCCAIMEIDPGSNLETIRNSYKRLCKVRRSDKQSGSTEALQELVKSNGIHISMK